MADKLKVLGREFPWKLFIPKLSYKQREYASLSTMQPIISALAFLTTVTAGPRNGLFFQTMDHEGKQSSSDKLVVRPDRK